MEKEGKAYIVLPGPPFELQPMFDHYAVPYLIKRGGQGIYSRVLRIFGIGESTVEIMVKDLLLNQKNPTIAPLASMGEVTLRLTAKASSRDEAEALIRPVQDEIEKRLGNAVYGYDEDQMETVAVNLLRKKGFTLAAAESCTGGYISNLITNVPGASDVFLESCITYSNQAKEARLGVRQETLADYGAVSRQAAQEMAEGIRKASRADIGIAVTGIAGPGGGTVQKPVGLVYIALSDKNGAKVQELRLIGDRMRIKNGSALRLLNWLRLHLMETE
jgi:nicotinamide-nucleotide amidase